ncbi:MAG TPA: beta-ketoacyl synthase chain length factor [Planctomycetota bacterium]|nr:beta-ketoacyl synthase chain length factor [Planctomycetota bacterium]
MRLTTRIAGFAYCAGDDPSPSPAWVPAGTRRRMDAFARIATVAVDRLVGARRLEPETAMVLSTSYGAVDSTFRFVGSIAAYRDEAASPTPFTTSVHNAAAGALGELLGLHGPATTVSQGGLGTLSALRWATLMLGAGRAPAVLAVLGDRHNEWSRGVVAALAQTRFPIGDGVVACLIETGPGPGRELRLGTHPAAVSLDGAALDAEDERELARRASAAGQQRLIAPELIGRWWPACLLAALDGRWQDDAPLALRECEDGIIEEAWLGPYVAA